MDSWLISPPVRRSERGRFRGSSTRRSSSSFRCLSSQGRRRNRIEVSASRGADFVRLEAVLRERDHAVPGHSLAATRESTLSRGRLAGSRHVRARGRRLAVHVDGRRHVALIGGNERASGQNAVSQAMAHFAKVAMRGRLDGLRVGRRRRPTLNALSNAPRMAGLSFARTA